MGEVSELFCEKELEKKYNVFTKGFIIILEPKNLTDQTSGIIKFGKKINVDEEIGEMIENRVLSR